MSGDEAKEIRRFARSAGRDLERLVGAATVFAADTETGAPTEAELRRHLTQMAKFAGSIKGYLEAIRGNAKTIAAKGGE